MGPPPAVTLPMEAVVDGAAPAGEPPRSPNVAPAPTPSAFALWCWPVRTQRGSLLDDSKRRAHATLAERSSTDEVEEERECMIVARRTSLAAWLAFQATEPIGLPNLGNSCYMNAALQCLLNTPQLTAHFLSGEWRDELNRENPLGTRGAVAEAFARLISDLWPSVAQPLRGGVEREQRTRRDALVAFKRRLERHRPELRGYRQHDAQELASFLLDGLHEDLNRCATKEATADVECNAPEREESVAAECWGNYLRRNRSIVVDLFQGQLRSTVVCAACGHQSTKFDPYMQLSLPLPPLEPGGCCGLLGPTVGGATRRRREAAAAAAAGAPAAAHELTPTPTLGGGPGGPGGSGGGGRGGGARAGEQIDLSDCLAEFFEEEKLGAGNLWRCAKCNDFRAASKRISIYKLPPILIIHLKRYAAHRHKPSAKRDDAVAFPLDSADLSPFVSASQPVPPKYSLYAVCRHMGTLHHGHYAAAVRRNGEWVDLNDDRVRSIAAPSLCTAEARKSAYLLFYARDAPVQSGTGHDSSAASVASGHGARAASNASTALPESGVEMRNVLRQTLSSPQHWPFDMTVIPQQYRAAADGGGRAPDEARATPAPAAAAPHALQPSSSPPRVSGDVVLLTGKARAAPPLSPAKPSAADGVGVEMAGGLRGGADDAVSPGFRA